MSAHITLADVAKAAGVHKSTVSRALNESTRDQVNAATVKRVRRAAEALGYVPNVVARGLRMRESMTIGVLIPDLLNPIFPPMISGMNDFLGPHGYTVLMSNAKGADDDELAAFESMRQRRVDGFILATSRIDSSAVQDRLIETGSLAVMVNREPGESHFPAVTGDDEDGIKQAIDHLAGLGHTQIGIMPGPPSFSTSRRRRAMFESTVRADPSISSIILNIDGLTVAAGEAAMAELLQRGEIIPTAIVAGNDLVALGVIRQLRAHGLRCPEDVSVVGYNDMPFAGDLEPALTTVHVPLEQLGYEAAALLIRGIQASGQRPVSLRLPVELKVRKSTAPPRSSVV